LYRGQKRNWPDTASRLPELSFEPVSVLKVALGKARDVNWLMWIVAAFFVVYFALDPIKQALGIE